MQLPIFAPEKNLLDIITKASDSFPDLFTLKGKDGTYASLDYCMDGRGNTISGGLGNRSTELWDRYENAPTGNFQEMHFTITGKGTVDGKLSDIFMMYQEGTLKGDFYHSTKWDNFLLDSITEVDILSKYTGEALGDSLKVGFSVDDGSVPEPTALALLALGVAGLALRRKAA